MPNSRGGFALRGSSKVHDSEICMQPCGRTLPCRNFSDVFRGEAAMMTLRYCLGTASIGAMLVAAAAAHADPIAAAGFSVTTFAPSLAGTSGADSVEVVGNNVFVGYSNGTAKDGTDGKTSTIVEYTRTGAFVNSTTVVGHTDGLRFDATTGKLWSMQNEDANPNLVLIDLTTLAKSPVLSFAPTDPIPAGRNTPHGGGYDDVVFVNGKAFVSASNPADSPNNQPALSSATLNVPGGKVAVTGVLNGNAAATPLNAGAPTTLNLQDPDSLSLTKDGKVVMTSQADSQLIFITNLLSGTPAASVLQLQNGVQVDDTVFAGSTDKTLLVADKVSNKVFAVTGNFGFNRGISAFQDNTLTNGFVGGLNPDGSFDTILSFGPGNPAGEAFLTPEPASAFLLGGGLLGLIGLRRKSRTA
jgi:hypothetical protein